MNGLYEAINKLNVARDNENIIVNEENRPFSWCVDMMESSRIMIAGCSGSGKSVALKDIIYTMMATSPEQNQFVFVDLKRIELRVFKAAPHTIAYVTEPDEVVTTLKTILDIIDERYRDMERTGELVSHESNIWVVIDEYADLVTIGDKRIEKAVQRIAQIGRASRVGIILCTQRPTREIVAGAISANIPVKLACRTVTKQDSRNILGVSGAESLPDYGYGIMQINGRNKIVKIPFLEQRELNARVVEWIKNENAMNNERNPVKKCFNPFWR